MTTQQYLNQARRLNDFIESDKRELERLYNQAAGLSGINLSERVQGSAVNGSVDGIIDKINELKCKINEELKNCIALKNEIWDVINAVINDDERLLLRLRYIEFMRWTDISLKMRYSERRTYEIHEQALKNVIIPGSMQ